MKRLAVNRHKAVSFLQEECVLQIDGRAVF